VVKAQNETQVEYCCSTQWVKVNGDVSKVLYIYTVDTINIMALIEDWSIS